MIFSLARSSIFCDAVHCNPCLHVCIDLGYGLRQPCRQQRDSAFDLRGTFAAIFLCTCLAAAISLQHSVCSMPSVLGVWDEVGEPASQKYRGIVCSMPSFWGVWDEAGEPAINSFSQSLCCTSNLQSCSAETDCGNRAGSGNFKPLHAGDAAGTFAAIPP